MTQQKVAFRPDHPVSLPVLQIPMDFPRASRSHTYQELSQPLPSELQQRLLVRTAAGLETSPLLLTACAAWTYRLSGEPEMAIDTLNAAGDPCTILLSLEQGASFRAVYTTVLGQWMQAASGHLDAGSAADTAYGLPAAGPEAEASAHLISWNLTAGAAGHGAALQVRFDASLLAEASVQRFLSYYITLLSAALADPDQPIARIPLLTAQDEALYARLNDTAAEYPRHQTMHGMFEAAAAAYPDRTALSSQAGSYSYRALNERANQIAHLLAARGLRTGGYVAIFMERSLETVVSLLGILKAGGVYVPLDPEHPEERTAYILEDTRSALLLTKQTHVQAARQLVSQTRSGVEVLLVEQDPDHFPVHNPNTGVQPEDLAYIIYTSGSTGKPKGAQLAHAGVVNLGTAIQREYAITEQDVLTQYATYSFDASVWDTVGALFSGAELYLLSKEERISVEAFADAAERTGTTIITILPTIFFNQLAALLSEAGCRKLSRVRILMVGGEALYGEQVRSLQQKLGTGVDIVNLYGPTEATVVAASHRLSGAVSEGITHVPIGRPLANYQVYVVNEDNQLCPPGVPGELLIASVGLAQGYLNQPDKTAQAFVPHPFAQGELIYRSGDMVKLLPNGTIEYVTRRDSQVKIRGNRIEIGEIEDCFAKIPEVHSSAVIPKKEADGQTMLVGYFTTRDGSPLPAARIREFLESKLPGYFVPKYICQLDHMPLSPTGKMDRKQLAGLAHEEVREETRSYTAPQTEMQQRIAAAWEHTLRQERIAIDDSFFAIGGDSLMVIQVLVELKPLTPALTIGDLFQYKTIRELAERMEQLALESLSAPRAADRTASAWNVTTLNEHPLEAESPVDPSDYGPPQHILLTGATGYLGSHLLYDILRRTSAQVYALVRRPAAGTSMDRLLELMKWYFGEDVQLLMQDRVQVVEGDLGEPRLALRPEDDAMLRGRIDTIIHAAADVRHFGDSSEFERTNVLGTEYLLEIAESKPLVRFHHVSTLGVPEDLALSGQWDDTLMHGEFLPELSLAHINVYTNSKLEAEKRVFAAAKRGLAVNIYRAGNLSCHSETGRFQRNIDSNAFYRMFKAMFLLGRAPRANWYVDFTPIDYASSSILELALRTDTIDRLFHICNPVQILYSDLLEMINRSGYAVEAMAFEEYQAWLLNPAAPKSPEALQLAMAQLEGDGAKDSDFRYGCAVTSSFLRGTGISCPPADLAFIQSMISYAAGIGYFPAASALPQTAQG